MAEAVLDGLGSLDMVLISRGDIMSSIYDLLEIIREEGMANYNPSFYFAEITSKYPKIKLKFNDVDVDTPQISLTSWVRYLAKGHITKPNGNQRHTHNIEYEGLNIGDTVLIKLIDDKVLIIDKVVS